MIGAGPGAEPNGAGIATDGRWPESGDWAGWAATWEARMTAFYPRRSACVAVILDLLAELLPAGRWRILDLGAGTGTLAGAALRRFPEAQVTALDLDPVLMRIGRGALGDAGGRLRWVRADLRGRDWPDQVGGPFDAVLSLATLHHFASREIAAIYHALAGLLRPDGLLIDAEDLADGPPGSRLVRAFEEARRRGSPPDDGWWEAVGRDPALAEAVAEREALRDRMRGAGRRATAETHRRALRRAGFAEAAVAWRYLDEAVLVALR